MYPNLISSLIDYSHNYSIQGVDFGTLINEIASVPEPVYLAAVGYVMTCMEAQAVNEVDNTLAIARLNGLTSALMKADAFAVHAANP